MQPTIRSAVLQASVPHEVAAAVKGLAERERRSVSQLLRHWVTERARQEVQQLRQQQEA